MIAYVFSHITWDYSWLAPSAYQTDALNLALAHPSELPPQEVALAIATAYSSEWFRAIKWFSANATYDMAIPDIIDPLLHLCNLLITLIDSDWEPDTSWWAGTSAAEKQDILSTWETVRLFLPYVSSYFSRFTLEGISLITNCIQEYKDHVPF